MTATGLQLREGSSCAGRGGGGQVLILPLITMWWRAPSLTVDHLEYFIIQKNRQSNFYCIFCVSSEVGLRSHHFGPAPGLDPASASFCHLGLWASPFLWRWLRLRLLRWKQLQILKCNNLLITFSTLVKYNIAGLDQ